MMKEKKVRFLQEVGDMSMSDMTESCIMGLFSDLVVRDREEDNLFENIIQYIRYNDKNVDFSYVVNKDDVAMYIANMGFNNCVPSCKSGDEFDFDKYAEISKLLCLNITVVRIGNRRYFFYEAL